MGDDVAEHECSPAPLAEMQDHRSREHQTGHDTDDDCVPAGMAGGHEVLPGRLPQLTDGDLESAYGHMGPGERALRQLADDGII